MSSGMPNAVVDCSGQTKLGSVVLVQTWTLKADAVVMRRMKDTAETKQDSAVPAIAAASDKQATSYKMRI